MLPSEDEGFGLPAVEALACGTPVVACEVPALREVLGDRATFVDAGDIDALIDAAEAARRPAPAPPPWSWEDAGARHLGRVRAGARRQYATRRAPRGRSAAPPPRDRAGRPSTALTQ